MYYPSTSAHEWQLGEPTTRRLRIFAVDPSALVREGKYATIEIPYEKLAPGPVGCLFEVDTADLDTGKKQMEVDPDLDGLKVLLSSGMAPSDSNPAFHAQMVYGVASLVHRTFRRALGRQIPWPFPARDGVTRLRIRPFAGETQNAWYDPNQGTLNFGYFYANEKPTDGTLPRGIVYTALSHDIVCHEMTHAMLDALRSNFVLQTSADMSGFHEGFSDLMALFHHFLHKDALRNALARSRGNLRDSKYLSHIGQQFGRASGGVQALRSACNTELRYDPKMPAHQMGELLMAAVFDAFCTVYERKTASIMRLATGGTGRLPEGDLPEALVEVLTTRAHNLASQFLNMLIRAVDYLPPVDVRLGEYLRAIITADSELVPDDTWNYREALIDAFRLRGVYPREVVSLNEDSLLWRPPRRTLAPIKALSFREIYFSGDPGSAVTVGEQIAQACELGEHVTGSDTCMEELGLVKNGDPRLEGDAGGPAADRVGAHAASHRARRPDHLRHRRRDPAGAHRAPARRQARLRDLRRLHADPRLAGQHPHRRAQERHRRAAHRPSPRLPREPREPAVLEEDRRPVRAARHDAVPRAVRTGAQAQQGRRPRRLTCRAAASHAEEQTDEIRPGIRGWRCEGHGVRGRRSPSC